MQSEIERHLFLLEPFGVLKDAWDEMKHAGILRHVWARWRLRRVLAARVRRNSASANGKLGVRHLVRGNMEPQHAL